MLRATSSMRIAVAASEAERLNTDASSCDAGVWVARQQMHEGGHTQTAECRLVTGRAEWRISSYGEVHHLLALVGRRCLCRKATQALCALNRCLLIRRVLIFDSRVERGIPSFSAAPPGPAILPLHSASAVAMSSFSRLASKRTSPRSTPVASLCS